MESHAASTASSAPASGWSLPTGAKTNDPNSNSRAAAAAQLRARLLKLIVANETARTDAGADASKPR